MLVKHSWAQTNENSSLEINDTVIEFINCPAQYPGGIAAFKSFLAENLDYNHVDTNVAHFGKIYLSFVVQADGSVTDIDFQNFHEERICLGDKCPLDKIPNWIPACNEDGPVKEKVVIPINISPN